MLKIAIDTGHGLNTAGKEVPSYMGYGKIKEWELNNKVTLELIKLLDQHGIEWTRLDDPTGKSDVALKTRTDKANKWGADLLISNHHNAGIGGKSGGGLVVFRYPNSSKFTKKMQKLLYDCIINETGLKGNRASPLSEANFHILRESNMPAVLIEHGFMDSPSDMKVIMQDNFAKQSAKGILEFLKIQYGIKGGEELPSDLRYGGVLKRGAKGDEVKKLQEDLITLGYSELMEPYGVDGSFGKATETAVRTFQKDNGLVVDGSVGRATQAKIDRLSQPPEKVDKLAKAKEYAKKILEL